MSASALWSHEAAFPVDLFSAARTRAFVTARLVEHEMPPSLVADVEQVGSELVTNALLHAETPFTVTVSRFDCYLRLAVLQSSPAEPVLVPAAVVDGGALRLAVIAALSARWGVATETDGRSSVWAVFDAP